MTARQLTKQLVVEYLEDGIETLSAHEHELAEGLEPDEIDAAVDHANGVLRVLAKNVRL